MIIQTDTMLKFTPMFHHSTSSIIKKLQTHYSNFPNIHMITNDKTFHITNFPKICISNKKPFHISSCSKKDTNSVLKEGPNSIEKLQLHVSSAFEAIISIFKRVFSSVIKEPYRFVVENDQILFRHNGKEIVGVVQHVVRDHGDSLMIMTLQTELGLLENFNISSSDLFNQTFLDEEGNEKMWTISTVVECKDGDFEKMKKEIKDILNANDELNFISKYNYILVNSFDPEIKIDAITHVTVSKLRTPCFEHYMEVRRNVLSEIDEIRIKRGGSKEKIEFEVTAIKT
ncbi:hypothetical protein MKX01_009348 [Papaver californicum]|nr:hypothetical protein MKX01_009348 [Papaver californicum]